LRSSLAPYNKHGLKSDVITELPYPKFSIYNQRRENVGYLPG